MTTNFFFQSEHLQFENEFKTNLKFTISLIEIYYFSLNWTVIFLLLAFISNNILSDIKRSPDPVPLGIFTLSNFFSISYPLLPSTRPPSLSLSIFSSLYLSISLGSIPLFDCCMPSQIIIQLGRLVILTNNDIWQLTLHSRNGVKLQQWNNTAASHLTCVCMCVCIRNIESVTDAAVANAAKRCTPHNCCWLVVFFSPVMAMNL